MHDSPSPSKFTLPTIFVIFGITGDLVQKKILRALYDLYLKKRLPERFRVYGVSRRDFSDEMLRSYLEEIMDEEDYPEVERHEEFLSSFFYVAGDFLKQEAYDALAQKLGHVDGEWSICSNKLFYLAVPPDGYAPIVTRLHDTGLTKPCGPEEGWTRVILEKPFGTDKQTAIELDSLLGKLFKEEQIYRVDHYLAKETVKNILIFRFANSFLTPAWNKDSIEKIEVRLLQKGGVLKRGDFYDKVGALRDVGQNHMLQLLGLFLMDPPQSLDPLEIKQKRGEALASLRIMTPEEVSTQTVRAQYEGYRRVQGVDPDSTTETYFRIKAYSDKPAFAGVPLYLESGKAHGIDLTEVVVTFKQSPFCLYAVPGAQHNVLHYYIRPEEKISMKFYAKKPGFTYEVSDHALGFNYRDAYTREQFIDDYEALLYDIIRGDQTLFVSTGEVLHEWAFIEPIVKTWHQSQKPELTFYPKGSYTDPVDGLSST